MATGSQQPHRGILILVLGILGIVTGCCILAPIAWWLGANDLKEMDAGRMDPSGRDLTNIGKILGMVGTILAILAIVFYVVMMVLGVGMAAVGV